MMTRHRFRQHLHRERRRLLLFVVTMTLASFLLYSHDLGLGIHSTAISAIGTGVGAGLIALGLLMVSPAWRQSLDTVGISSLLYVLVLVQVPGLSVAGGNRSLVLFVGYLATAAGLHALVYGGWSDRLLRLPRHVERSRCRTGLDRETLWRAIHPSADTVHGFWDASVRRIKARRDGSGGLVMLHRYPDGTMRETAVAFERVRWGVSLRYAYETLHGPKRGVQTLGAVLEQRGAEMVLHLRVERSDYPMRLALMHWLDDSLGRIGDSNLSTVEARAARAERQAAVPG